MKFRMNLLATWFAGWITSILLALLCVFSLAIYAFPIVLLFLISIPACFCYYAGLKNRNSLIGVAVLASLGLFFGAMLAPQVTRGPHSRLEHVANSALAGCDELVYWFFFSGLFMLCGIILDPNTKKAMVETASGDAIA